MEKNTPSELISGLGDDLEAGDTISSILLKREEFSPGMKEKAIEDCIKRLKKEKVEKRLRYLKTLIKEGESKGKIDAKLLAEYQHFSKLKNRK